MMSRQIMISLGAALLFGLAACGQESASQDPQFRVTATIQDLMQSEVDPSADYLWEAVSLISTQAGTQERLPRTDKDWAEARRHAITLIEATNLLIIPGRRVAAEGKKLEDAETPGNLTAAEVQKAIDGSRDTFVSAAHGLHDAATKALAAIDSKSVTGLEAVGEKIDAACEACHATYWYPNSEQPVQ